VVVKFVFGGHRVIRENHPPVMSKLLTNLIT